MSVRDKGQGITILVICFLFIQSFIIAAGLYYQWDWVTYQFAGLLLLSGVIVLVFGLREIFTLLKNQQNGG